MFEAYNDVPKYARPYVESNRYNRFVSIPLVSTHVIKITQKGYFVVTEILLGRLAEAFVNIAFT